MSYVFEKQWAIQKWKDDLTPFRMYAVVSIYINKQKNHSKLTQQKKVFKFDRKKTAFKD